MHLGRLGEDKIKEIKISLRNRKQANLGWSVFTKPKKMHPREYQPAGFFLSILIILVFAIFIPILTVLALIFIPYLIVTSSIDRKKRKEKLKNILGKKNGEIFLLYKEYNQFNFNNYFKENNFKIDCLKIETYTFNDPLLEYLAKDTQTKGFPCLVKIIDGDIITKQHYNSFKYYVKRNKDLESFFSLLRRSINNLKNEIE